jgi:hypothetical protein
MQRSSLPDTDIATDREGRLASALDAATVLLSSLEQRLAMVGAISRQLPLTSPELIWRLQLASTVGQVRSLSQSIELLAQLREDVADVHSTRS